LVWRHSHLWRAQFCMFLHSTISKFASFLLLRPRFFSRIFYLASPSYVPVRPFFIVPGVEGSFLWKSTSHLFSPLCFFLLRVLCWFLFPLPHTLRRDVIFFFSFWLSIFFFQSFRFESSFIVFLPPESLLIFVNARSCCLILFLQEQTCLSAIVTIHGAHRLPVPAKFFFFCRLYPPPLPLYVRAFFLNL